MSLETYCIRPDYQPNTANLTLERDGVVFWTKERLRASLIYQWPLYEFVRDLAIEKKMSKILDIGCGPARKLMTLLSQAVDVYGIDQESAIAFCKEQYTTGHFYTDNFEEPELILNETFDLIICSDVIEHLEDPDVLLRYIRRFCSETTLVLLSTPERDRIRGENCLSCPQPEHIREWNSAEFSNYLETRNFEILKHFFLPPLPFGFTKANILHWLHQFRHRLPLDYNQAVLCRPITS